MANFPEVVGRLDAATSGRRLLDHPFYRAWAAGTLSTEDLAFYSTQYWRQVEALPDHLEMLSDRLPEGAARATLKQNLRDERDGDHPAIWMRFAEELGVTKERLAASPTEPETRACVTNFKLAMKDAPAAFALGMLYGYESQVPDVSATKIDGLRRYYGVDGDAVQYFELHAELDVEHASQLADAVVETAGDTAALREAEAGAVAGAAAVWLLLDGVTRARAIT